MAGGGRKKLLEYWETLDSGDQRSLLDYARFLVHRAQRPAPALPIPHHEPRPNDETVVAAIKRLTRVYHMLDRRKVLGETTMLMSRHIMEGRSAREVIDQLEQVFASHYRRLADRD